MRAAHKQVGSLSKGPVETIFHTGGVVNGDLHFNGPHGCTVPFTPMVLDIETSYDPDWMEKLGIKFPVTTEKVPGKQEKFAEDLDTVLEGIRSLLIEKNRKYGDSALTPSRIFSNSDAVEQIKVRIDDKLTRLKNQQGDEDEDVAKDLLGYLIILQIAELRASEQA